MTENPGSPSIALTGATGFVGQAISDELSRTGRSANLLVRKRSPHSGSLHTQFVGDLFDASVLARFLNGVECIIHVAGAISAKSRAEFFRVNVEGTRSLLNAAKAAGVNRFVYISSLAARHPELSDYAASKNIAESLFDNDLAGLSSLVIRPCAVYGERDLGTLPLIKSLLTSVAVLPGNKHNRFSLIHVHDFAQICLAAAGSQETGRVEVDDTSGGYYWLDLARITRKHFSKPSRMVFIPRFAALALSGITGIASAMSPKPAMLSRGKVNELYHQDWTAEGKGWPRNNPIFLEQGLLRTINWYRDNNFIKVAPNATGVA